MLSQHIHFILGDLVFDAYDVMGKTAIACLESLRQCISCIDEDPYLELRRLDVCQYIHSSKLQKGSGAVIPPDEMTEKLVIDDDEPTVVTDVPFCIPPLECVNKMFLEPDEYEEFNTQEHAEEECTFYGKSMEEYPDGMLKIGPSKVPGCAGLGVFWTGKDSVQEGTTLGYLWGKFIAIGTTEYDEGVEQGKVLRSACFYNTDDIPLFLRASGGSVMAFINCPPVGVKANCILLEDSTATLSGRTFPVVVTALINPSKYHIVIHLLVLHLCQSSV